MNRDDGIRLGDMILLLGVFVWVTFAVGPWWLGVALFGLAWVANIIVLLMRDP